jgi:hypothetical protein
VSSTLRFAALPFAIACSLSSANDTDPVTALAEVVVKAPRQPLPATRPAQIS